MNLVTIDKDKINNIGIFWEGELVGGVDSYLYNLINADAFNEIDVVIFTNKNNLGAKKLSKNLGNKKINAGWITTRRCNERALLPRQLVQLGQSIEGLLQKFGSGMGFAVVFLVKFGGPKAKIR